MDTQGCAGRDRVRQTRARLHRHTRRRSSGRSFFSPRLFLMLLAISITGCSPPVLSGVRPAAPTPNVIGPANKVAQAETAGWFSFASDPGSASTHPSKQTISTATVSHLRRAWTVQLPELADERPILVRNLAMPDGKTRDVLYLTTDHGTLVALDAATGTRLWATRPKTSNPMYTKATPVADPAHNLVYSYGLDGKVHRFRATTGKEVPGDGWPVTVTLMPRSEKVSSSLNLVNGYLYVTTASFSGDAPPYQGHMVAINVRNGETHVFNSLCNDRTHLLAFKECPYNGGGIWARPGVVADPVTGHIFFTTSDGFFDINHGGHDWGDSVIEMTPDGSRVLDSYTPENYATESFQNRDLGSTAPTMLPRIPNSRTPYLAVQAGKEGLLRLLNRQNLSGKGGPSHVGGELQTLALPDLCPTLAQPLAWQDPTNDSTWIFVDTLCHMDAFRVITSPQGVTSLRPAWKVEVEATSPIVTGGVLFAAVSHNLLALDPRTGHQLWSSALRTTGGTIDRIHWESPIIVDNRLYCTDEAGELTMYQL